MSNGELSKLVIWIPGHVVSYKNKKRAILDKNTGKMRTLTNRITKQRMEEIIRSIESQLLSGMPIKEGETWTAAQARSWIASLQLPEDDSRHWVPELILKAEDVPQGQEGALIEIERLP